VPYRLDGRPSKSLTFDQAKALLAAAERSTLHAYVVLSLMTGARTEELRALTGAHVDLEGRRVKASMYFAGQPPSSWTCY
jgi:integrase